MYDEKLEALIEAALEDGILTEKEKQILFRNAQERGIDLDEFEMVLDARLVKLQKEAKSNVQVAAPKSNKYGDIKKCPSCGAVVQSYHGVCQECGYAFENLEANSSIRKLSEELEKKGKYKDDDGEMVEDEEKMAAIIKRFPVPTSKGDLIELINYLQTFMPTENTLKEKDLIITDSELWTACESKIKECSRKAKLLFPNDKLLTSITSNVEEQSARLYKQVRKNNIKSKILGTILTVVALGIGTAIFCTDWKLIWKILTLFYTALPVLSWGIIKLIKHS